MPDQKKLGLLAQAGLEPYQEKPGEEYMNDAQRAHFKKLLEAWRSDLRNEVDRTKSHMQDEAANFPDPVDRAAQEEEFSLELRTRDRERKLIKKIEKTLQLIEDDDFGYCDSCGIEIGIRRLEARPTADLCVDCKSIAEIKEKQQGRG
ncbi:MULTISPECIES: RNA polymerase-binding protein DksA [Pseudoalteromonas]|uniref:RNA polymerase-binding transcription factor DksA n=1 Tax=Pseudoalteromonas rubra TaxID=43658 RepID=A0A0L0EXG4_9GAMM|nr:MULTISPECIES: RNA polymerase-binding protein DksA [Pseudoalteromonas]ALU43127.1 RNA polymerase-binding transcription factor [Pseudoalteromonas rubra]KAF7788179.1 DnaK suppressor protein [Pseudoalteromonas rubra]KNC69136.1 RNA polymerase-binding transcription factor [Pseudoalteromonas rubra]MCG7562737.1 RNA polymerase-binding protein DksA [Pseudoalteromonas sp. McH1-42]MCO7188844.1 RNA polymerase-binding protein DksA [Pseudoalteromonas sp. XMcav2-N]